ncbi:MAG: DNA gyrase inhibitor YacG [Chakrabartia sp.]
MSMSPQPDLKPALCPLCRKPAAAEHLPFCSRGCKDRDLLNWLGESYRVPARVDDDEQDSGLDSDAQA